MTTSTSEARTPFDVHDASEARRAVAHEIGDVAAENPMSLVSRILGYDVEETVAIEGDHDLFGRVIARMDSASYVVDAEKVLGDLSED